MHLVNTSNAFISQQVQYLPLAERASKENEYVVENGCSREFVSTNTREWKHSFTTVTTSTKKFKCLSIRIPIYFSFLMTEKSWNE